jgi:hypothetical protein
MAGGFRSRRAAVRRQLWASFRPFAEPAALAGSGQTIAWTNVTLISSPAIRTAEGLPSATWSTNAL